MNPHVNPMMLKDAISNPCWRLFFGQMAPPWLQQHFHSHITIESTEAHITMFRATFTKVSKRVALQCVSILYDSIDPDIGKDAGCNSTTSMILDGYDIC